MKAIDAGRRATQRGFGYLVLLLGIVIGGTLLTALSRQWAFDARREREAEFVFRAEQYRDAIRSYVTAINLNGCSNVQQFPTRLEDLIEDRRCGMVRHHLRRLYPDPLTNSPEWGLVSEFGAIHGVYSLSTLPTIRHVEGVKRYCDWRFVADAIGAGETTQNTGTAGSASDR